MRRKIRGLLRTSYLLIKAHNQTIEKLYHPDSVFVNTVLKSDFESVANLPPLPPSKTDWKKKHQRINKKIKLFFNKIDLDI